MAWSWYTKGRRIPTLIGKDVSGRRIPGGPYTALQAITAAAAPALLWSTRGLWAAEMSGLTMVALVLGLSVAAVKLVGKVDFASRNPLLLLAGYLRQTRRPASGTLAGRKLTEPKTHRVTAPMAVAHLDERRDLAPAARSTGDARTAEAAAVATPIDEPLSPAAAAAGNAHSTAASAARPVSDTTAAPPGAVAAALRPATAVAPDRRRTGLEAFLAGAAAARTASTEEDAA